MLMHATPALDNVTSTEMLICFLWRKEKHYFCTIRSTISGEYILLSQLWVGNTFPPSQKQKKTGNLFHICLAVNPRNLFKIINLRFKSQKLMQVVYISVYLGVRMGMGAKMLDFERKKNSPKSVYLCNKWIQTKGK